MPSHKLAKGESLSKMSARMRRVEPPPKELLNTDPRESC